MLFDLEKICCFIRLAKLSIGTPCFCNDLAVLKTEFGDVPVVLYGPFEAPVYRVQNMCRMRFVLKCRLNRRTRDFISGLVCEFGRFTPTADKTKNAREAGTSANDRTSAAVSGAKSSRRLTISVDLNPTTV